MKLTSRTEGADLVVSVHGTRIDAAAAVRFKDQLREAMRGGRGRVILDLGEVEFIDSSGLGAIVASMKLLGRNRRMDLAALNRNVDKVFRLTRMDSVFHLHHSIDEALAA